MFLGLSIVTFGQNFDYQKDYASYLSRSNDLESPLFYSKLLSRFTEGDTSLQNREILHLLIGFTAKSEFQPYRYFSKERDISSLVEEKEYQRALQSADSLLAQVPVSQQAILGKSVALHYLEEYDESRLEFWKFQKIMKAMAWSGDGMTPETAFFALGPADGQNFINLFLRKSIGTMGSGSDKYGNFVDILEIVFEDPSGNTQSLPVYFQIEHAAKTMFGSSNDSGN